MNYDEFLNWCEDKWTREYKMKRILSRLYDDDIDFLKEQLKADIVDMLEDLQYDLCHELCKEIHIKENCPCTNQTTSCLATFRVCDADRAISKVIQEKINSLKGE